jgi:hypothetical protein
MDPRETGFALERLIGAAVKTLHSSIRHLSESEIKTELADSSLNGVDHWISYTGQHILIQTKWRETTTQPEVGQFLACVDRIRSRIPEEDEVYLIWASKTEPTKNAKAVLAERNVYLVCCSISMEALARNVVCWVAETFGLDPTPGLLLFPVSRVGRATAKASSCVLTGGSSSSNPILTWDETEEGKRAIQEAQQLIQNLQNSVGRKVQNSLSQYGTSELMSIVNAAFPQRAEDWWNGSVSKVNFNSMLRSLKSLCVPTKTKHFHSRSLFCYCKMRYISTELASQVAAYMSKRTQMISSGSAWAKKLAMLVCQPEPMTQEEFKACVVNCQDYWMHVNRDGKIEKVPSGLENQFFYNYYAN